MTKSNFTEESKKNFSLLSLLSTSVGYGSAELGGRIIQFAATFYLVRICTKAEFGAFGFLMAVQQAVAILGQAGIVELLMEKSAHANSGDERERIIRTVHDYAAWHRLGWFILASGTLMIFTPGDPSFYSPYILISVSAGGYFISKFFVESSTYQILQSRRLAIYFKILPIVLMNTSGIIAYHISGNQLQYFFIGVLAGLVISLIMTRRWSLYPKTEVYLTSHKLGELIKGTAPYAVVAILGWLTGYGNNVVIGSIFNAESVAEYTLSLTLSMPIFMICNATNQAWYPKFIELSRSCARNDLNRANAAASAVQLLLAALASMALIQVYPTFFALLGGNLRHYSHSVQYAGLLMLGYVCLHLYYRVFLYFLIFQESRRYMIINAIASVFGIVISILLMIRFGVIGIYAGFIFTNALTGILFSYDASRRWDIQWPLWNLALAALTLGPVIYFSGTMQDLIHAIFLNVCSALILCIAWYGLNWKLLRLVRNNVIQS